MAPDLDELLSRIRHGERLKSEDADVLEHHLTMDTLVSGVRNRAAYQRHVSDYQNSGIHVHVDANDFGQINKLHGEQAGDAALQAIGKAIHGAAAPLAGRVFRRGGDEFTAWFLRPEDAQVFAGKLKSALKDIPDAGGTHKHAVSIGIGRGRRQAEEALLRAKAQLGAVDATTGNRKPNYEAGKAPTIIDSALHEPQPQGWKSAVDRVHEIRLDASGRHDAADAAHLPAMGVSAPIKHAAGGAPKHVMPEGYEPPADLKKDEDLKRLHPALAGGRPFVLMSGENPRYKAKNSGHEILKADMQAQQKPFEEVEGMYDTPERSLLIYNMGLEEARAAAKKYGQESFMYSDGTRPPAMVFANGAHADHWHPGLSVSTSAEPPDNYYTALNHPTEPGKKIYMQSKIDWANLKPLRQMPSQPGTHGHGYPIHGESDVQPVQTGAPLKKAERPAEDTTSKWGTRGSQPSNLRHYDFRPFESGLDDLAARHGYAYKTMGGPAGMPDLGSENDKHGTLWTWDEGLHSDGSSGDRAWQRTWRKAHELAKAQTRADVEKKYGPDSKDPRAAVEHAFMAAHKQRDIGAQLGHHIGENDFNRELNTVMASTVHRLRSGVAQELSATGFQPHPHPVALEEALNSVSPAPAASPAAPLEAEGGGKQKPTPPAGA